MHDVDSAGRAARAPGNRPGEDPEGRAQRTLGNDREDPRLSPDGVDGRPVVVRRDERVVGDGYERLAVGVADGWADLTDDRPRDLAVGLERRDGDGHVVMA